MSVEVLPSCWSLFHLNITLTVIGWNLQSVGIFCEFERCHDSLIVLPSKNYTCIYVCLFTCRISEESRFSLIMLTSKNCIDFLVWMCLCVAFQHQEVCCRWNYCCRICSILGLLFSCLTFCSKGTAVASVLLCLPALRVWKPGPWACFYLSGHHLKSIILRMHCIIDS